MRILLVMPTSEIIGLNQFAMLEPLGLITIAAYIQRHSIKIIDLRIEPTLKDTVVSYQPHIVGIHCVSVADTYRVRSVAHEIKKIDPRILTVVGGHHPTLLPRDFDNEHIDVVVIGDGEITFRELVDHYESDYDLQELAGIAYRKNGEMILNRKRKSPHKLDDTRIPQRELIRKYSGEYYFLLNKPIATVPTSKGCLHRCKFCSIWPYNQGKYRVMGPSRVIKELLEIEVRNVFLGDDNFLQNTKRVSGIYEAIKASGIDKEYIIEARSDAIAQNSDLVEKWRNIGLRIVGIGLEYIRNKELNEVDKKISAKYNNKAIEILKKNDIKITGLFIVNPDFDESDFEKLSEYILKKEIDYPFFAILTPLPGTVLYHEKYSDILSTDRDLYNLLHAVLPTKLSREKFYKKFAQLYKDSWLASIERNRRSFRDGIPPEMGLNLVTAFKKLSNYQTYIEREEKIKINY
ncbi:MAG: B12-binding domain-containing radical SAM protein [Promethearchaeota archaeon]